MDITPNTSGVIAWLREAFAGEAYDGHDSNAVEIMRAGWPKLTKCNAVRVLQGVSLKTVLQEIDDV